MAQLDLTELELRFLENVVATYISEVEENGDVVCFTREMSSSEKGIVGSLVKKGMIYDMSLISGHNKHNFYPTNAVLDIYYPTHQNQEY